MDLKLASKLIKYNPQDVQSTVYVVEYAQHNFKGDDVATYINEHLKSNAQYAIAQVILAETALANTIKAKPSAASGKIDSIKEKPSTTGSTSPAMKSIEAKGDAKKVGFKGVPGTGTNVVQKEEYDWVSDVVEELGEDFDLLTDEDLENLIFEALEGLETEELLVEAVDVLTGTEVLMEAPSQHSAMPNVAVQAPQKKAAASPKAGRMSRLAGAARKVGSALKSGAKTAAKGAVRGAGYASGLAQRAGKAASREFSQGRQRGLGGSGSSSGGGGGGSRTGGSSSSSSTGTTGSSSGGSTPTTTGGSSSGGGGEKKPGPLSRAAGAIGRGLRKAVGAGAKVAGKAAVGGAKLAGKAAVGGAKLAGKAAVGTAKGVGKVAAGTAKVAGKTAVGGAKLAGKAVGKTAQAAGSAVKATGKAAGNVAKAAGRGVKKVVGKTARGVSKVSGSVASKLGEEQQMDNRVDRVRKMLAMQETLDHDKNSASWRGRLGWDLEEEKTAKQKEKSAALEKSKQLTNSGKHKEASDLFKKHFPNFGK